MLVPAFSELLLPILAAGFLVELCIAWPNLFNKYIGHPVSWFGALAERLETFFRRQEQSDSQQQKLGALVTVLAILIATGPVVLLSLYAPSWVNIIFGVTLATTLIATKNLRQHVFAVAEKLIGGNMTEAKYALKKIVSRDVETLTETQVSSAAIESLAENTSDGVIAPLFWAVLFGAPGMVFYKSINTLDSMWGYRNSTYEHFGKFAARLDDAVNWLPARLTALLYMSPTHVALAREVKQQASGHRSPNAGWPESAVALILNIQLGGARQYSGDVAETHLLNEHGQSPTPQHCIGAIKLYDKLVKIIAVGLIGSALLSLGLFH